MILFISLLSLTPAFLSAPQDTTDDPAFKQLAGMVGGKWEGSLGKMHVTFVYKSLEGGKMVEGMGNLTQDGKTIMNMDSKFGWDPAVKQTYYLDCHGHDTVYEGHVFIRDGQLTLDFNGLIGDKGHWITTMKFPSKDDYQFEMYEDKDGKLVPTHVGVKLHRSRS